MWFHLQQDLISYRSESGINLWLFYNYAKINIILYLWKKQLTFHNDVILTKSDNKYKSKNKDHNN